MRLVLSLALGLILAGNASAAAPQKPHSPGLSAVLREKSPQETRIENLLSESQGVRQELRKYVRKLRRRKTWTAGGSEAIYYDAIRDSDEFLNLQNHATQVYAQLVTAPSSDIPAHLAFRLDGERRAMKDTLAMVKS